MSGAAANARYDIDVAGIETVMGNVDGRAGVLRDEAGRVESDGDLVGSSCGTATEVAEAFQEIWAERDRLGTRSADYAESCAAVMSQALSAFSSGDEEMGVTADSAGSQAVQSVTTTNTKA